MWVCTVVVGMLLRKATSQGVAPSFIVVASLVTAVLLLGWRAVATARDAPLTQRCSVEFNGGSGEVETVNVARSPPSGPSDNSIRPPCNAAC